ncbi:hypothetical protein NC797_11645 [Aquibacillus sp. 3ASR75-11]|uniref:Peptidase M10 metallopeptidase domain-containing protein n=1 Tax=Terrihalobacillus insolitus TaxID=2950438 RepID=A0A9X3WUP4_9BACI|nr:hypothetical protein [Terrihalobacillus insolitus]MDC3413182.1 hypothetical protein [Terrihalobacillus insolitus]MDC3425158.1 hypothetical protein [Terrihalobacillus insolitus]
MSFIVKKILKSIMVLTSAVVLSSMFFIIDVKADYFGGSRSYQAAPYAWYHSSVYSYNYDDNYDAGRGYWNDHFGVNIKKTYDTGTYIDRYYVGNTSTSGLLGRIQPINGNSEVASVNEYWYRVNVFIYDNQMRAQSSYNNSHVSMNAAHEIGHSIKMAHASSAYYSVMPQGWRTLPYNITSYDSGEIDAKWY